MDLSKRGLLRRVDKIFIWGTSNELGGADFVDFWGDADFLHLRDTCG